MKKTFADKVIQFNSKLVSPNKVPAEFTVLNPFIDNPETMQVMKDFYRKYFNDHRPRRMLLGINPGRHGAAVTGVPFTDTKRLEEICGLPMYSVRTHEVSSVFIYDMISNYGGVEKFYSDFYINSPFPLAIVREKNGKQVNANYYDDKELFNSVREYMIENLRAHIALGIDTSCAFVLGIKNHRFISELNKEAQLFDQLIPLEHPRYIQQYKSKDKEQFIGNYLEAFIQER